MFFARPDLKKSHYLGARFCSIEEKIYQRQIVKGEAAAAVGSSGGGVSGGRHFSQEDLKELFTLREDTKCDTFDLLSRSSIPAAERWRDHSSEIDDEALAKAVSYGGITFVQRHVEDVGNLDGIIDNAKLEDKNETELNVSRRGCDSGRNRNDAEGRAKSYSRTGSAMEEMVEDKGGGKGNTGSYIVGSNCTLSTDDFSTTASAASALAWSLKPQRGDSSKFARSLNEWSDEAMTTPYSEGGRYDDDNFSLE